jgi:hypothetical protein
VGFYFAMPSRRLLRLAEVVEGFGGHQEHQDFVFASKLEGTVQPFPLDVLTVAGGRVTIADLVPFWDFRPRRGCGKGERRAEIG